MNEERAAIVKELEQHLEDAAACGQRLQLTITDDIINLLTRWNHLFPPKDMTISAKVDAYRKELLDAQCKAWLERL